jgi:pimeloyl-ACP methyl ester carboxylesterase
MWGFMMGCTLAMLREGLHFQTVFPASTADTDVVVLYVNGGPMTPTSYVNADAVQRLADLSGLPMAFFDWCGVGRSTCSAAATWEELQEQAREALVHARTVHPSRRLIVMPYSAGALTMPSDALVDVAAVVYLNPVVDQLSSVLQRRRCVREYLEGIVSVLPYRVVDTLGSVICSGGDLPIVSFRATLELFRATMLRERVVPGYQKSFLRPPGGVPVGCLFVAVSEEDRVIDTPAAVAFHDRWSKANDTFVVVAGAGHFPVAGECNHCAPISHLLALAASRCGRPQASRE